MVDQLNAFRLGGDPCLPARRHRGPARRPGAGTGVAGLKDLTDNVNSMASNLTAKSANMPRSDRHPGR